MTVFYPMPALLFRKTDKTDEILKPEEKIDESTKTRRIRCPLCQWQPDRTSRWCCYDPDLSEHPFGGCETEWNTFDTQGKCPGCGHHWSRTDCLSCFKSSPHEEWYE